jgi:DNA-binding NarL/FixJ family response regulator
MIRLIIVDDHQVIRAGLSALLHGSREISVLAMAENGQQALDLLQAGTAADIVLSDVEMPVMGGIKMLEIASRTYPGLPVVMLSMKDEGATVHATFDLGAKGYISKSMDLDKLERAIIYMYSNAGRYCCGLPEYFESHFTAIDRDI